MQVFKKAIISLDGHSSKINDENQILINIRYVLNALHIPMEIHQRHDVFSPELLLEEMNQEDTLYILNDSLPFHLCEKPNILLTRFTPWVESTPKPSTIGIFTHEMIAFEPSQFIACIARNKPVRQHHNLAPCKTFILANEFTPGDSATIARNGFAAFTWNHLAQFDIHANVLLHTSEEWPKLNEMLHEGIQQFQHPDDILIVINRDICLVPEATGIIRAFMDTHNLEGCFAKRVDVQTNHLLWHKDIAGKTEYEGIDLFAIRPNASFLPELLKAPFLLGRAGWDNVWANKVRHKLPYNVCYHFPHEQKWMSEEGKEGNMHNLRIAEAITREKEPTADQYDRYYKGLK